MNKTWLWAAAAIAALVLIVCWYEIAHTPELPIIDDDLPPTGGYRHNLPDCWERQCGAARSPAYALRFPPSH